MTDFASDLTALGERARFYGACEAEPALLLDAITARPAEDLQRYLTWVRPRVTNRKNRVEQIGAVNFLRMVLVSRLVAGEPVALGDIEAVQQSIEAADPAAFPDLADFHAALANSTAWKRSPFGSWSPFSILFGIDYYFHRGEVLERLGRVAARLREAVGCAGCDVHTAGFDFNNGFGTSECWLALYPEEAGDHKDAMQLFAGVRSDHYAWGLVSGSRVSGKATREFETAVEPPSLDAVVAGLTRFLPAFYQANSGEPTPGKTRPALVASRTHPLNSILYGPPGTGKTYAARRRAVEIVDGSAPEDDRELTERFRALVDAGRIEFVTFHPSYAYEEFVEGLRFDPEAKIPLPAPGIFKELATRAVNPNQDVRAASTPRVWKVSLGTSDEGYVFDRSMKNGEIAVSFGSLSDVDFTGHDTDQIKAIFDERGRSGEGNTVRVFDYLVNKMEEGDYVVVLKDQKTIRAIGIVTDGGYRNKKDVYDTYVHTRGVRWLDKQEHQFYEVNGSKNIGMPTLYQLPHVQFDEFVALLPKEPPTSPLGREGERRYVLVIDEINRGDLARIFGELITLLEPDKRRGAVNELTVRLPYSQETFRVPSNLHVVGTMNTADRSIALFDVALRRRFEFEEIMPDRAVIDADLEERREDEGFELTEEDARRIGVVFDRLNARVAALLDRDHQIGHSYFLGLRSVSDLKRTLQRRVFPLLTEYFYNDRERLTQVIGAYNPTSGSGFVETTPSGDASWTDAGHDDAWTIHDYPAGELGEALWRTFGDAT